MVSSFRRYKESRSALEMLKDPSRVDTALGAFRKALMTQWPDIATLLIRGGFDVAVRSVETLAPENDHVGRTLDSVWSEALDTRINATAAKLSHPLLQLFFNLPGLALMAYVGWLTAAGFFTGHYLTSDFFMHALLTIALVLLLSFFLFQGLVRLAVGKDRIQRLAFNAIGQMVSDHPLTATRSIVDQICAVLTLAELMEKLPNNSHSIPNEV